MWPFFHNNNLTMTGMLTLLFVMVMIGEIINLAISAG